MRVVSWAKEARARGPRSKDRAETHAGKTKLESAAAMRSRRRGVTFESDVSPFPVTVASLVHYDFRMETVAGSSGPGAMTMARLAPPSALLLLGCSSPSPAPPAEPSPTTIERAPIEASSAPATSAAPVSVEPVPHVGAEGAVYLAVRGTGLVRIGAGEPKVVYATTKGSADLVISPSGALFASFWEDGTIRVRNGKVEVLSKTTYHRISPRTDDDVFATPDPFGWSIDHYDGKRWKTVRRREDFRGKYEDNKLEGIAVTKDAVWVSTWNGLFRGAGSRWELIPLPPSQKPPGRLFSARDHVIGWFVGGDFEWDGSSWKRLAWPSDHALEVTSADGFAVSSVGSDTRAVRFGELGDTSPSTTRPTILPLIDSAAIDGSHRAWIVGGSSLVVVGPKGGVLAELAPGTIPGVRGRIERIAVEAGGPLELPAKVSPPLVKVRGVVQIFKSGKPLGSVLLRLCASSVRCEDGWHKETTTQADGSFLIEGVPPADLTLTVEMPRSHPDCQSPFTAGGLHGVDVARDCASAKDGVCDIGTISACQPFEMPPPR